MLSTSSYTECIARPSSSTLPTLRLRISPSSAHTSASASVGEGTCETLESEWGCDCSECECEPFDGAPDFGEDDDYDGHVAKCNQCLYQGKDYCIEENVCITRGSTGCER